MTAPLTQRMAKFGLSPLCRWLHQFGEWWRFHDLPNVLPNVPERGSETHDDSMTSFGIFG